MKRNFVPLGFWRFKAIFLHYCEVILCFLKKLVRSICKGFMEDFNYVASFPRLSIVIIYFFCRTDGLDWSLRYSEVCILCLFLPERDDD